MRQCAGKSADGTSILPPQFDAQGWSRTGWLRIGVMAVVVTATVIGLQAVLYAEPLQLHWAARGWFATTLPRVVAFSLAISLLTGMMTEAARLIGRPLLTSVVLGTYQRPVHEELIVMFLDIAGSTAAPHGAAGRHRRRSGSAHDVARAAGAGGRASGRPSCRVERYLGGFRREAGINGKPQPKPIAASPQGVQAHVQCKRPFGLLDISGGTHERAR
jgi:hypothetical protein